MSESVPGNIPEIPTFKFEPGSKLVLSVDSWAFMEAENPITPPLTFGMFDSVQEALSWLTKTGFVRHSQWDTDKECSGVYVYKAGEGKQPLVVNGRAYRSLGVRLSLNPPLPIVF